MNRLTTRLSNRGFQVVALSGELSQAERTHALQAMRDGRAQVCVATDVAARGIDLPNLDLVVHAELPNNHETLLHRSGRTGRAGRKGVSALIVTRKSRKKAERTLRFAKLTAEWSGAPSADAVKARDEERMLADPVWTEEAPETDLPTVEKLVDSFSPEQLAAAYLHLYRSSHTAPEELLDTEGDAKSKPRKDFGPSVWFSISGGRAAGAEPRRLLPMLCKAGDLTKDDIGAIRIQQNQSCVQILETSVARFLATVGDDMTLEEGAVLSQMAEAPVFESKPQGGFKKGGFKKDGFKKGGKPPHRGKGPDAKGRDQEGGFKPKPAKPQDSAPIDWNDDPAPRVKKPKPSEKPKDKPSWKKSEPSRKSDGGHGPAKRRSEGGKPGGKPKGPPPPKGKPNSKKNKARAAAKAQAKKVEKRGGRKA